MAKKAHKQRYEVFITKLREARQRAEITQIDAAKALSQTQTFISKVERGERRLDVIDLIDFLNVYGIEPAKFVEDLCHQLGLSKKSDESPSRSLRKSR